MGKESQVKKNLKPFRSYDHQRKQLRHTFLKDQWFSTWAATPWGSFVLFLEIARASNKSIHNNYINILYSCMEPLFFVAKIIVSPAKMIVCFS